MLFVAVPSSKILSSESLSLRELMLIFPPSICEGSTLRNLTASLNASSTSSIFKLRSISPISPSSASTDAPKVPGLDIVMSVLRKSRRSVPAVSRKKPICPSSSVDPLISI